MIINIKSPKTRYSMAIITESKIVITVMFTSPFVFRLNRLNIPILPADIVNDSDVKKNNWPQS